MWFARAGFPPGARAKKTRFWAPNHAQRLGAFLLAIAILQNCRDCAMTVAVIVPAITPLVGKPRPPPWPGLLFCQFI
jgi:hypothetical protein